MGAELFGWAENFWSLFPLILIALLIWGAYVLTQYFGQTVALVYALSIALVFPASMAVLGITRTPSQSLNPVALLRMIRLCGLDYVLIFLVPGSVATILMLFVVGVMPRFVVDMVTFYLGFLLFTFVGAVVGRSGASAMISIPDPVEMTPDEVAALTDAERTRILSHAYGFISRNDREGGFAHIQTYIDASPNPASDYHWFLNEMFEWESTDDALFFAQRYLTYLLDLNAQIDAMKLIGRCRLENSSFRPLLEDRERVLDVARRLQHEELEKYLSSF